MTIKLIDDKFDYELYNQKAPHPFQSWEYGEALKQLDHRVIRFGEFKRNELNKVYQIIIRKIPYSKHEFGYIPQSFFPSEQLVKFLLKNNLTKKLAFIKIIPYVEKKDKTSKSIRNLLKAPDNLQPNFTIKINLGQSEQTLWESLKKNTRYSIKTAKKRGVYVKKLNNQKGFETFIQILFETSKRKKFYPHNKHYHQVVFNCFKNNIINIFIAYYRKTPIAVCEVFKFNKGLHLFYSGMKENYKKYNGSSLLIWEIIKFGLKNKRDYFDFGGAVPLNDKKHPWYSLTKFKLSFGGRLTELSYDFDLVINKAGYTKFKNINLEIKKIMRILSEKN